MCWCPMRVSPYWISADLSSWVKRAGKFRNEIFMPNENLLQKAKRCFIAKLESQSNFCGAVNLQDELVVIRPLNAPEAIGEAGRDDFPITRRKEVLMQALYRGAVGRHSLWLKEDLGILWVMYWICRLAEASNGPC